MFNAYFLIDYYPKYHCEFNYIEMFWGAAKAWCRANCTFNLDGHLNLVKEALKSVTVCKIHRLARKSYRYMDAYRVKGTDGCSLSTKMIEYAVKKYRGHRVIPHRILETENLFKYTIFRFTQFLKYTFFTDQIETDSGFRVRYCIKRTPFFPYSELFLRFSWQLLCANIRKTAKLIF